MEKKEYVLLSWTEHKLANCKTTGIVSKPALVTRYYKTSYFRLSTIFCCASLPNGKEQRMEPEPFSEARAGTLAIPVKSLEFLMPKN